MIIIPAIDLRNGKCVRLTQGKFDKETIYGDNPVEVAKKWVAQGAKHLHLVDLDATLTGRSQNSSVIKDIVDSVNVQVQVGGGIRSIESIENMINIGVDKVIIGTSAITEKNFLIQALKTYADKIIVSIDAKDGFVALKGWTEMSNIKAIDLSGEVQELGVKTIVYTDIAKDGMLSGPNFKELKLLKDLLSMNIIAAGGITSNEDVAKLKKLDIAGAIIGKALYTGDINLSELWEA